MEIARQRFPIWQHLNWGWEFANVDQVTHPSHPPHQEEREREREMKNFTTSGFLLLFKWRRRERERERMKVSEMLYFCPCGRLAPGDLKYRTIDWSGSAAVKVFKMNDWLTRLLWVSRLFIRLNHQVVHFLLYHSLIHLATLDSCSVQSWSQLWARNISQVPLLVKVKTKIHI